MKEMQHGERSRHPERADEARLGEQQRQECQQRNAVREYAGRSDDAHGEAHGLITVVAFAQADADRRHHLHAVGKAHDHDERRHHVEEQVELEACPAEQPERPRDRKHWRQRGDEHQ